MKQKSIFLQLLQLQMWDRKRRAHVWHPATEKSWYLPFNALFFFNYVSSKFWHIWLLMVISYLLSSKEREWCADDSASPEMAWPGAPWHYTAPTLTRQCSRTQQANWRHHCISCKIQKQNTETSWRSSFLLLIWEKYKIVLLKIIVTKHNPT